MKTFVINNKSYSALPFSCGVVCQLEDNGIDFENVKSFNLLAEYFAVCGNFSKEKAVSEIDEHTKNGGSLNDLMNVMGKEMEESDFFRSLIETKETEKGTTSKKK